MERKHFITHQISLPLTQVIAEIGEIITGMEPELDSIEQAGNDQKVPEIDFTLDMRQITNNALLDELTERFKAKQIPLNTIISRVTEHIQFHLTEAPQQHQ